MSDDDTFDPYACPATKAPLNDDWAARRDAADAARQLIAKLVATTSDAATLRAVADSIRTQTDRLAEVPNLLGRLAFEAHEDGRHGDAPVAQVVQEFKEDFLRAYERLAKLVEG